MIVNPLKLRFWMLWSLTGLLVIATTGCTGEDSSPPTVTTSPALLEVFPSAVWQDEVITFTDPALGLTVDVPGDWSVHPRVEGPTNPNPIDILSSPCQGTAPHVSPSCTKIQISLEQLPIHDFNEMRELGRKNTESSNSVVLEEQELSLHGLPALWFEVEDKSVSELPVVHVMILVDERVVYLNAYGELSPVDDIVNSVRPIQGSTMDLP